MAEKRLTPPYPSVRAQVRAADGKVVYKAQHVRKRRGTNRSICVHLGTFENPLRAHYEVLNARANAAESRAKELRTEADAVLDALLHRGPRVLRKRGRPRKETAA